MTLEQKQMFKKMLLLGFGATLLITGLVILWFSRDTIRDMITERKKAYDALSVGKDELKPGDHVTVDVVLTEGYFMYKNSSTHKGNTVTYSSTTRYYLVSVVEEKDGNYLLDHLVAVSKTGQFKEIDAAAKSYLAWCKGEGEKPEKTVYSVDGRVVEMDDKELGYLKEYFGDEDYKDYMVPYVVVPLWDGFKGGKGSAVAMPITSVIVALIGLLMIIGGLRTGKKKAAVQTAQAPVYPSQPYQGQAPVYPNPQYQGQAPVYPNQQYQTPPEQSQPNQGQVPDNDQNPPYQG